MAFGLKQKCRLLTQLDVNIVLKSFFIKQKKKFYYSFNMLSFFSVITLRFESKVDSIHNFLDTQLPWVIFCVQDLCIGGDQHLHLI